MTAQCKRPYSCSLSPTHLWIACSRFTWQAYSDANTPVNVKVETCVSIYRSEPIVFFSIIYTDGLTNASIQNDTGQTLSSFPSFVVEETDTKRGYATWAGGRE